MRILSRKRRTGAAVGLSQRQERALSVAADSAHAREARTMTNGNPCPCSVPQTLPNSNGETAVHPLLRLIPTGRENATSQQELARMSGLPCRTIRKQIQELRQSGEVICSTAEHPGGYFLPECHEDIARFLRTMGHRMSEMRASVQSAIRALAPVAGQLYFEEVEL